MEETFLVNLYGSEEEINRFYDLLDVLDNENVVEMVHLIEEIKRRNVTRIYWNCCHRCQNFATCRINWYRGERAIKRNCCSLCSNYEDCLARMNSDGERPAACPGETLPPPQPQPVDPVPTDLRPGQKP